MLCHCHIEMLPNAEPMSEYNSVLTRVRMLSDDGREIENEEEKEGN